MSWQCHRPALPPPCNHVFVPVPPVRWDAVAVCQAGPPAGDFNPSRARRCPLAVEYGVSCQLCTWRSGADVQSEHSGRHGRPATCCATHHPSLVRCYWCPAVHQRYPDLLRSSIRWLVNTMALAGLHSCRPPGTLPSASFPPAPTHRAAPPPPPQPRRRPGVGATMGCRDVHPGDL
jgi:hypothetical protein